MVQNDQPTLFDGPEPESADWISDAVEVIRRKVSEKGRVTAADIRPALCPPGHPNWFGTAFTVARQLGLIRRTAYTKSNVESRNHGVIAVWAPGDAL